MTKFNLYFCTLNKMGMTTSTCNLQLAIGEFQKQISRNYYYFKQIQDILLLWLFTLAIICANVRAGCFMFFWICGVVSNAHQKIWQWLNSIFQQWFVISEGWVKSERDHSQLWWVRGNPGFFIMTTHHSNNFIHGHSKLLYVLLNQWRSQQSSSKKSGAI